MTGAPAAARLLRHAAGRIAPIIRGQRAGSRAGGAAPWLPPLVLLVPLLPTQTRELTVRDMTAAESRDGARDGNGRIEKQDVEYLWTYVQNILSH